MSEEADLEEAVQGRRACFGCFLIVWGLTVLPLLTLGAGSAGRFWSALRALIADAMSGDLVSIVLLVCSLPVLFVPYWLWAEFQHHRMKRRRG